MDLLVVNPYLDQIRMRYFDGATERALSGLQYHEVEPVATPTPTVSTHLNIPVWRDSELTASSNGRPYCWIEGSLNGTSWQALDTTPIPLTATPGVLTWIEVWIRLKVDVWGTVANPTRGLKLMIRQIEEDLAAGWLA